MIDAWALNKAASASEEERGGMSGSTHVNITHPPPPEQGSP